ncbi:MAG: hypothetical protein ABIR91_03610 [Candidatus Saccharimonadales bacterium]
MTDEWTGFDPIVQSDTFQRPSRPEFWLIQRIVQLFDEDGATMKPAEMLGSDFELSDLCNALDRLPPLTEIVVESSVVTYNKVTRPVYFIGDSALMRANILAFRRWVNEGMRSKEYTLFGDVFDGTNTLFASPVAWWSLDADVIWTVDRGAASWLQSNVQNLVKP